MAAAPISSSVEGRKATDAEGSAAQLQDRSFTFGAHTLTVACRKMPEQVARVTQTLQLGETHGAGCRQLAASAAYTVALASFRCPIAALINSETWADVDELFEQLLTWGSDGSDSEDEAAQQQQAGHQQAEQQQQHSKKICGNVAEDQPDLIGLDV